MAGFFIAIAATVYLIIGNALGAFMFSVGLITIVVFNLPLFTGKAGLLATNDISIWKLGLIWLDNLIGVTVGAFAV